jgi:hypothetical protein
MVSAILGEGGEVTLYVDGKKAGEGSFLMTQAIVFSADDGCEVGEDSGAPVSPTLAFGRSARDGAPFQRALITSAVVLSRPVVSNEACTRRCAKFWSVCRASGERRISKIWWL